MTIAKSQIRSVPVEDLYSRWGAGYNQGRVNNLQGLDDVQLERFLPKYISLLQKAFPEHLKVVDFGCGTGRNTLKLAIMLPGSDIVGLDATKSLLDVAERQSEDLIATRPAESRAKTLSFQVYNPLKDGAQIPRAAEQAQGIICTLVLVHIELSKFFKMCDEMLVPGGYLLITNTHSDLANVSHGNFLDPETGEQLWSDDHIHTVDDVKTVGAEWGFELLEVQEGIPENPDMVGAMRGHWEGVKCWIGFILRKCE
ncbi:S-adenosyl-L-methionine-dependent methyltransferase [Aspergillus steynii IBT 23096]|uniref:S-adenosyl-L-methionine-dependent methyltransferase n=1 Tax=Aspergillus steynii IBT 23096 TaxID=1392250 RepID=A0A2I2G005_9EURO|nr:S-adenosyl-L-methionine-dependent methyltransferase [Aspergillus steynii IBT 23096]PLB46215.1 S-adenosyl-L-methionine-dependent methyltransferase [Aspergillus steynii IBT 23096]